MSLTQVALFIGFAGATIGVMVVFPQIARILRNPGLSGVSAAAWSLTSLACMTWMIYGLRTHSAPQVPGNLLLVTGSVLIVLLAPNRVSPGRRGIRLAGVGGTVAAAALLLPARQDGYLAFGIGLVSAWPQVYDSISTWRAGRLSGVSLSAWGLRIASQVCWFSYALATGDRPVLIATVAMISTALTLILLEASARTRAARADPRPVGQPGARMAGARS